MRLFCPVAGVSTHAPLAGSDRVSSLPFVNQGVSTHAPLAGSDSLREAVDRAQAEFQPTLPLRGATGHWFVSVDYGTVFQPTLPLRGATRTSRRRLRTAGCFNPRSPCGERQDLYALYLEESKFQPTLPLRGATGQPGDVLRCQDVSTHAPLAGSDVPRRNHHAIASQVSTHAPLAGSDPHSPYRQSCSWFQPTLPLRGATQESGSQA